MTTAMEGDDLNALIAATSFWIVVGLMIWAVL